MKKLANALGVTAPLTATAQVEEGDGYMANTVRSTRETVKAMQAK